MNKKIMLGGLFALLSLALLGLAIVGGNRFPLINSAVATIVLPAQEGMTALGNTNAGLRSLWRSLTVLQEENASLQAENNELRSANIKMAAIHAENQQLRRLLEYKQENQEQRLVPARVIARAFGQQRDSIYIDVGSNKGLKPEMAVINGGLIGIVDQVYGDYAKVLLLTSVRCNVGARILRSDSRAVGVVGGNGENAGNLTMRHIYREASVEKEDVVVTSGYSGTHPENILIGKVVSTSIDEVGLLRQAQIVPAADVADVEYVLVVTEFTPLPRRELIAGGGLAQ